MMSQSVSPPPTAPPTSSAPGPSRLGAEAAEKGQALLPEVSTGLEVAEPHARPIE